MGDEHKGLLEIQQKFFKPEDGADVEMIGGLIKEQQVRIAYQSLRQKCSALEAGGQEVKACVSSNSVRAIICSMR